jgi:hypothetical protein
MPRCPLCGSSHVAVLDSLHPQAFCSSCGARWIQDGRRQRAIKQVHEPSFVGLGPRMAQPRLHLQEEDWPW